MCLSELDVTLGYVRADDVHPNTVRENQDVIPFGLGGSSAGQDLGAVKGSQDSRFDG